MKVTRNIDTGDEKQTIRTISTKPKEHFEGRWKSGRLYPLYSVVVNNGTTFISQNAKMKEEPYVIYDADKKEFKAPDGWLIKEMSADSRVTALGGGGEGGVTPEEVEEMIKDKVDKVDGKGLSTNDYDNTEKNKVASAYQKPNNGIPKSDLAKAVQDVLDDADGAYKKPVTGIPFTDLADGVQDSLSNADEAKAGLAGKQDTISDLSAIRSGAAAGATSIQPAEFNELKDEVDTIGNGAYEEAWDGDSTPVVADIPAGVVVTYSSASYTGTLAASSSTVDKIYLVSDGNGNYDRYTTVEANGAYSWKKVGSTAIPLSNYATKTQVSQLQQEVDGVQEESVVIGYDRSNAISRSINTYSKWANANSSILIPITPGKKYKVQADSNGTFMAVLQNNSSVVNQLAAFSSQFPNRIDVPSNTSNIFTCPSDGAYLYLLLKSSAGELYPVLTEEIDEVVGLVEKVSLLETETESLEEEKDALGNRTKGLEKLVLGETPRNEERLFPVSIDGLQTYSRNINGTLNKWHSDGSSECVCIPATELHNIRLYGGVSGNIYAFLKDIDNITQDETPHYATGYTERTVINAGEEGDYTVPDDCGYIYALTKTSDGDSRIPDVREIVPFSDDSIIADLSKMERDIYGERISVENPGGTTKRNIYIDSNGVVKSGYTSASIDVSDWTKVHILNNAKPSGATYYYAFLTADIATVEEDAAFVDGTSLNSIPYGKEVSFDIPNDAVYLYLSINRTTYPTIDLFIEGLGGDTEKVEKHEDILFGVSSPVEHILTGNGTAASPFVRNNGKAGIDDALADQSNGGKVVIPSGCYDISGQIVIPYRNIHIEGAVWNYPQDPNGVHESNTGTKLKLLSSSIESILKTASDMSGMRIEQLGFQGLTTSWDYDNADGNGADYYFDPANLKNIGLYIGSGRFDQVSLHRLSFCGLAVGILAKYTIDANVWSEINTDGCDFGIFVDYNTCHHPKILNNILSDCVGAGLYYKTTAGQNSYGLVADGNVLVRNASYLTPAQIAAGIPQASLVLIGHQFASVINNTIVLSGVYKRRAGGENYTAYEGGIGLYFSGNHCVVKGNKIVWSTSKAATISGNYNTISDNVIVDEHDGVSISGNYNSITGNIFDSVLSVAGNNNKIEGNTHTGAITLSGDNNEIHGGPSDIITVSGNNNVLVGFSPANVTDNGTGTVIK